MLILLVPVSVKAGLIDSLSNFFTARAENVELAIEGADYSPVNTPLLSASQINPVAATGGGDVTVTDGALVATAPVTEEDKTNSRSIGEISVYTVREGDTLSQIAQMYGVTANTIMWANDIQKASAVQPGDTLVILPIAGVQHTIKDGETLASIVKKYDADLNEVLDYNNIQEDATLVVGEQLMVPGGSIETAVTYSRPTPTGSAGGGNALGFSHPVPGAIRTQGIHGYNGVDYGAAYGTPIRAAAGGEVIVSKSGGWNGGYGSYIVIRHGNGTQTLYAHLSANYVSPGEYVASGETIGAMGSSGRSTGTHLHFEVRGAKNPF